MKKKSNRKLKLEKRKADKKAKAFTEAYMALTKEEK
jgi:hypothetical protein